jgi:hypothetical protein
MIGLMTTKRPINRVGGYQSLETWFAIVTKDSGNEVQ